MQVATQAALALLLKQSGNKIVRAASRANREEDIVTSGCQELDTWLPASGFRRGAFAELLFQQAGSGATSLAWHIAWQATKSEERQKIVVVDGQAEFYPLALPEKLPVSQVLVVRPQHQEDTLWAMWQALRCNAVAAVICRTPSQMQTHTLRRLQLAAEASKGLGLLLRPSCCRNEPSWGDVRICVQPQTVRRFAHQRQIQLELLYARGAFSQPRIVVELDHETHTLRVVPPLAATALASKSSRATRQMRRAV